MRRLPKLFSASDENALLKSSTISALSELRLDGNTRQLM